MGFTVQLIMFYKKLFEPFEALPIPRVYCISSHEKEDPSRIIARYVTFSLTKLMDPLYDEKTFRALDPRGIFLILLQGKSFIWIGSKIPESIEKLYHACAFGYLKILQKYEKASDIQEVILEDHEPAEFWDIWPSNKSSKPRTLMNPEWNNWYIDFIANQDMQGSSSSRDLKETSLSEKNGNKPLLYIYPKHTQPLTFFYLEDLEETTFCILCINNETEKKCFLWKGSEFDEDREVRLFLISERREFR